MFNDISTPPNIPYTLPPVGPHPPANRIIPSHRALCQCLIVCASITMIQSTIYYFNAFSVQLHLAVNDRVQSVSAQLVSHVVTYYLASVGILVRLFSPWCSCNRQTVFVTSAKRGCFVAVCLCTVL